MSEIDASQTHSQPAMPTMTSEAVFELGKLYADRVDFVAAIGHLRKCCEISLKNNNYSYYLKAANILIRIHAEREEWEEIQTIKDAIQDLVLREGFELNAKTYYTLSVCAGYKDQNETAVEYLQKSLTIALANDSKEDICHAIHGMAICYSRMGRSQDALKEIYNLQVFFQVIDVPEVRMSSQILNARILMDLKKYEQAIELLWQTYDLVRANKNLSVYLFLLYNMGWAYYLSGEKELAQMYIRMAEKSVDRENLRRISRAIDQLKMEIGGEERAQYDLVFDLENHTVTEKKLGQVEFKNQFILLDLLKLFVTNQGQVYSKEFLVEQVWKQQYNPIIHDNKIYVTVKRLRKLIEPDLDKPKYIFRAKNGYFMNKSAKILLNSRGGENVEKTH